MTGPLQNEEQLQMMKAHRKGALGALAVLSTSVVLSLTPAAAAQLEGVIDDTTDTIGKVGDTVGGTTDQVGDAVGETGGTVGDTVGDTGGKVGDTVGGKVGDGIKDTSGGAGKTVKDTSDGLGNVIKDAGDAISGPVDEVEETIGHIGGDIGDVIEGGSGGNKGPDREPTAPQNGKAPNANSPVMQTGFTRVASASLGATFGEANRIDDLDLAGTELVGAAPDVVAPVAFEDLVREAVEAARQFAFPLALTLMVVAYMLIQGRLDSRDPKLAVAAIDTEEELVSFS